MERFHCRHETYNHELFVYELRGHSYIEKPEYLKEPSTNVVQGTIANTGSTHVAGTQLLDCSERDCKARLRRPQFTIFLIPSPSWEDRMWPRVFGWGIRVLPVLKVAMATGNFRQARKAIFIAVRYFFEGIEDDFKSRPRQLADMVRLRWLEDYTMRYRWGLPRDNLELKLYTGMNWKSVLRQSFRGFNDNPVPKYIDGPLRGPTSKSSRGRCAALETTTAYYLEMLLCNNPANPPCKAHRSQCPVQIVTEGPTTEAGDYPYEYFDAKFSNHWILDAYGTGRLFGHFQDPRQLHPADRLRNHELDIEPFEGVLPARPFNEGKSVGLEYLLLREPRVEFPSYTYYVDHILDLMARYLPNFN